MPGEDTFVTEFLAALQGLRPYRVEAEKWRAYEEAFSSPEYVQTFLSGYPEGVAYGLEDGLTNYLTDWKKLGEAILKGTTQLAVDTIFVAKTMPATTITGERPDYLLEQVRMIKDPDYQPEGPLDADSRIYYQAIVQLEASVRQLISLLEALIEDPRAIADALGEIIVHMTSTYVYTYMHLTGHAWEQGWWLGEKVGRVAVEIVLEAAETTAGSVISGGSGVVVKLGSKLSKLTTLITDSIQDIPQLTKKLPDNLSIANHIKRHRRTNIETKPERERREQKTKELEEERSAASEDGDEQRENAINEEIKEVNRSDDRDTGGISKNDRARGRINADPSQHLLGEFLQRIRKLDLPDEVKVLTDEDWSDVLEKTDWKHVIGELREKIMDHHPRIQNEMSFLREHIATDPHKSSFLDVDSVEYIRGKHIRGEAPSNYSRDDPGLAPSEQGMTFQNAHEFYNPHPGARSAQLTDGVIIARVKDWDDIPAEKQLWLSKRDEDHRIKIAVLTVCESKSVNNKGNLVKAKNWDGGGQLAMDAERLTSVEFEIKTASGHMKLVGEEVLSPPRRALLFIPKEAIPTSLTWREKRKKDWSSLIKAHGYKQFDYDRDLVLFQSNDEDMVKLSKDIIRIAEEIKGSE